MAVKVSQIGLRKGGELKVEKRVGVIGFEERAREGVAGKNVLIKNFEDDENES